MLEKHKEYLKREDIFKSFGYDTVKEREFILTQASPISGRILEAGTGKGNFTLALAKAGYSFVTFDISAEQQDFARENIAYYRLSARVDFRIANAEHTAFPDGSFDTVLSVNTVHHLESPYRAVDELIRILSPKGKIVLADFTKEGFHVLDRIHALEGNTHDEGKARLTDIGKYLEEKNFVVKETNSKYQHVVIAERNKVREQ